MKLEYIVFSSGGVAGSSMIGALQCIEEKGIDLSKIKGYSGCSAGSMIALTVSLGFTIDELKTIVINFKYEKYAEMKVLRLLDQYGIETGKKILDLYSDIIHYKTGLRNMTFAQHWAITGRYLWINSSCLEKNKPYYYSVKTSPNMLVLDAIRQSISIPFIFTAVFRNGLTFIDGGYHDTVPARMFPSDRTLCFRVISPKYSSNLNTNNDSSSKLLTYSIKIFSGMFRSLVKYQCDEIKDYEIININVEIDGFVLKINRLQRHELIRCGYNQTKKRIDKILT